MNNKTKYNLGNLLFWLGGAGILGLFVAMMIGGLSGVKFADMSDIVRAYLLVVALLLFIVMMIGWIGASIYSNLRLEVEE